VPEVVIAGGGISGLSTAYYLSKAGVPATIIESRPYLGGVIRTEQIAGCTIEAGPDSFLSAKPAALELIRELGIGDEVIGSNDHLRVTFVKKNGRLVPLPDGLMMMVPTKVLPLVASPLLGFGTKFRMGVELLRPPKPAAQDQSVADFVREHYGQEAVDYLAEPLLSGVYGGDPSKLSVSAVLPRFVELAAKYGSLTRGVLVSRAKAPKGSASLFRTLKGGLGDLVNALSKNANVRTARVETIERAGDRYRVRIAGEWIETDRVVLACEAHSAASLVSALDGRLAELLGGIAYSSSMIVALVYHAGDFQRRPVGFGFLVPKKERKRVVACTWVGTKFSHRAPEDKIIARCFLGGAADEGILKESDSVVLATVNEEMRDIAGVTAQPIATRISRWPRAMAQYNVGHAARIAEIRERLTALPGIYIAGNAYEGIGIPDCIRMGRTAAEAIARG
jgi:oxygen-dependent protoporphyrinogen oxidase